MAARLGQDPALQFGGIVLIGGLSRRMGTDKASLVVDGLAMVDRVTMALRQADVSPIAVAGSDQVPDPEPEQGPMAGIVAGWRHLREGERSLDAVVVLSCDLPAISTQVAISLTTASMAHTHGAVAHDGERPQPLIAAYRPAALDQIEAVYVRGGRSVRRCFDGWDLGEVRFDPGLLRDADTPEDLKSFEVEWPG